MKCTLIATGKQKRGAYQDLAADYLKRLQPFLTTRLIEIPQAKLSSPTAIKTQEAKAQTSAIPPNNYVIALDEHGTSINTKQLANKLKTWQGRGQNICFLIGGAEGLDHTLKTNADEILKLSDLTLPHQLARILLLEQLYRACTILKNHPYHRD